MRMISKIFYLNLVLLNDTALYELILRDDKFEGVLGMLECNFHV